MNSREANTDVAAVMRCAGAMCWLLLAAACIACHVVAMLLWAWLLTIQYPIRHRKQLWGMLQV
jgi:hypothetical protein